ncbi:MAG: alginate export family protein [Opitutae bacterium]|nr:alginate export family protein [Opitutae bacterium]MBT5691467.1 alginate export family protein [Opitutae bacterium]MBT7851888.1 alginate export family protein [Opitutae bacterium]
MKAERYRPSLSRWRNRITNLCLFCCTISLCHGTIDLSAILRHRSTYFEDFGIYEKNRMKLPGAELEHEFRGDLFLEKENALVQLRVGRWFGSEDKLIHPPKEEIHRLHQAYLDIPIQKYPELTLRVGRQELRYNREILIGANDWDMEGFSFDAAKLVWDGPRWDVDLLYGRQAGESGNTLAGINLENTTPQKTVKEIYAWYTALPHDQDTILLLESPEVEVMTIGARMEGKISSPLFYHGMINFQTGKANELDVEAFNLLLNLDWFVSHPVVRNLGVEFTVSSGDDDRTSNRYETFLPPFASDHNRSGAMDWMSLMNSQILTFYLFADLHPKVETLFEYHQFHLQSGESAWYLGDLSPGWWGGTPVGWPNDKKLAPSRDIGSELDFHARIGSDTDRQFSIGYSLFFPGKLLKHKDFWDNDQNVQWAYIQSEFKF